MGLIDRLNTLPAKHVGIIMALSTLIVPFMILPTGSYGTSGVEFKGYSFLALLWGVAFRTDGLRFYFLDFASLFFGSLHLPYTAYIYQYCSGKTSWMIPVLLGVLPILFFILMFSPSMIGWHTYDVLVYAGPLPITFILGLILMRVPGAPKIVHPFDDQKQPDGQEQPSSWWENE